MDDFISYNVTITCLPIIQHRLPQRPSIVLKNAASGQSNWYLSDQIL